MSRTLPTGLDLTDGDGTLREELPPVTTFLNRLLALPIALQNVLFGVFDELLAAKIEGAIASGSYDAGVETLTAESLTVTDRRTVYTHPGSGAETRIFTIARRDRNHPTTLEAALDDAGQPGAQLFVNAQSGRAAVRVAAPSLMLDDGRVERRVRLIRPMERGIVALEAFERSHWKPADAAVFAAAWTKEVAELPEFTDSLLHIVTGLLLPIWRRLPGENCRVYRLQTDAGERIIGRLIPPLLVAEVFESLGAGSVPVLSPAEGWRAVTADGATLQLADGLAVRRSLVMGLTRVELTGFTDGMVARLKALGLSGEIIQWRLRLFIPFTPQGARILEALLERHPLLRTIGRG